MTEKQYIPLFNIPIVKEKTLQIDLNYYGIRQKLKNFGIDTFKKVKENNSIKSTSEFDFKQYWQDMNKVCEPLYSYIDTKCVIFYEYCNKQFWKDVRSVIYGHKKENS